jgi:Flp pilus assembly protein TadG
MSSRRPHCGQSPITHKRLPSLTCRRDAKRRGAVAIEFALVAGVFFLLVFAIFEFGRVIMIRQVLVAASREGARAATLEHATEADVRASVEDLLADTTVAGATVEVSPTNLETMGFGDPVTVRAQIPYSSVTWLAPMWISGSSQLTGTSVMRIERPE